MNIVRISTSTAVLKTLSDIDELRLTKASLVPLDEDQWRISGYATDAAIEIARSRGALVDVLFASDERLAQLDRIAQQARDTGEENA